MKIKWGALVVDGRGKIGGQVASKNKAGAYLRTKVTPTNPNTAAQTSARQLFAAISQGWSGLNTVQRNGWNNAVSDWSKTDIFGDLKQPSGKALFQRLNNQAQSAGWPAVTTAPAKQEMVEGVVTNAGFSIANGELSLTGATTSATARIMVFSTPNLSDGTTFVKDKLRLLGTALASTYDPVTFYDNFTAKYGLPSVTDNHFIGIKYVLDNGQASPMQVIKLDIS